MYYNKWFFASVNSLYRKWRNISIFDLFYRAGPAKREEREAERAGGPQCAVRPRCASLESRFAPTSCSADRRQLLHSPVSVGDSQTHSDTENQLSSWLCHCGSLSAFLPSWKCCVSLCVRHLHKVPETLVRQSVLTCARVPLRSGIFVVFMSPCRLFRVPEVSPSESMYFWCPGSRRSSSVSPDSPRHQSAPVWRCRAAERGEPPPRWGWSAHTGLDRFNSSRVGGEEPSKYS